MFINFIFISQEIFLDGEPSKVLYKHKIQSEISTCSKRDVCLYRLNQFILKPHRQTFQHTREVIKRRLFDEYFWEKALTMSTNPSNVIALNYKKKLFHSSRMTESSIEYPYKNSIFHSLVSDGWSFCLFMLSDG